MLVLTGNAFCAFEGIERHRRALSLEGSARGGIPTTTHSGVADEQACLSAHKMNSIVSMQRSTVQPASTPSSRALAGLHASNVHSTHLSDSTVADDDALDGLHGVCAGVRDSVLLLPDG